MRNSIEIKPRTAQSGNIKDKKQKNICIFEFWHGSPYTEISFELAIKQIKVGNKVDYYYGTETVRYPELVMFYRAPPSVFRSQKPIHRIQKILAPHLPKDQFSFDDRWLDPISHVQFPEDLTAAKLLKLKFKNFEIGRAVASTLCFMTKKEIQDQDIQSLKHFLRELLLGGVEVYLSVERLLKTKPYDMLYVCNGRFVNSAAVAAAAEAAGVECHFTENAIERYYCVPFKVHDFSGFARIIDETWRNANPETREEFASQWFDERIDGTSKDPLTYFAGGFNRDQNAANIQAELGVKRKAIVFFQSSDDEYAYVHSSVAQKADWKHQREIVEHLLKVAPEYDLIIRIHPHMKQKHRYDRAQWKTQFKNREGVYFIDEDSLINSYELTALADIIVTCGSTIGAESIYMGKSVILCGRAFWETSKSAIQCMTWKALEQAISSEMPPADKNSVLHYGYFMNRGGDEYQYYKPLGLNKGTIMGVDIYDSGVWV